MKSLVVLLLLLANHLFAAQPKVMRALLAVDSVEDLRDSTRADREHMKEFLEFIAHVNSLSLDLKILKGSEVTSKNIKTWLDGLKPNANEIYVFYFTGHGYRTSATKSKWPNLFLSFYRQSLESPRVTNLLLKKNPRFLLAIYDCCNSKPVPVVTPRSSSKAVSKSLQDYQGFKILFCKSKGHIVICGSTPGSNSFGTDRGGIFTTSFIIQSLQEAKLPKPSWNTLLDNVRIACSKYQVPLYDISLKD